MRVRQVLLWMAVAVVLVPGLLLAAPAAAAPLLIEYVQPDDVTHLVGHQCVELGSDQFGTKGISCADIAYSGHSDGTYYDVWGHNQVFCQNAALRVVQCAGIHETVGVDGVGGASIPGRSSGVCGARFGHSPCAAARVQNSSRHITSYVVPNQYWGTSTAVSIVLPRSNKTVGPHDLASRHIELITKASI